MTSSSNRTLVLEAGRADAQYWRDLWTYRELFAILAWRDISVRYKQTVIGATWAFARPLVTVVIFSLIFGRLAALPSDGSTPYPIMVFAGMLPWFLFATILTQASSSLVANTALVGKVYFPRLIIPASAGVVGLVDFAVGLVVMFGLMIVLGALPDWRVLALPVFAALAVAAALGPALALAALNVKYRDVRLLVPFLVQFGLYVSPVGFSSANIPDGWRLLYGLNPMVGVIDGARWSLLGGESSLHLPSLLVSLVVIAGLLCLGLQRFRATERTFADLI